MNMKRLRRLFLLWVTLKHRNSAHFRINGVIKHLVIKWRQNIYMEVRKIYFLKYNDYNINT